MRRDFTYIDDVTEAVVRLVTQPAVPIQHGPATRLIRPRVLRHGACITLATASRWRSAISSD